MTTRFRAMVPGCLALLILAPAARADAVPTLDVEKTCRSSQVANTSISDQANYDGCLRSEREARKEAERHWATYSPAAKRQCQDQFKAGGYPSYVEMVTCLELASGTVPTQSDAGGRAVGGPGSPQDVKAQRESGTNLTKEPPASQRVDPMKVLDKK
ncbi:MULTISPECIES: hypothetical protein [Methylobacterium]|jgi:hypothetical protein|uniref:DUF1311 domain-containing protein n=1 Tax=Methylobacterium longum TaxID=767694 RepID=A0ABT8AHW5_9HYPH|nr:MULTISPECIES: hypothetical protein [Methylobacterium]MCJ2100060.1 hypothetical protein [Methylobacterium sp. E-046]MDN3569422.1 hypothetical protein [Methylobacterium longum]GJE12281.1 hypothetical protein FOHLNKBM_3328 [Methylobacterium longum]